MPSRFFPAVLAEQRKWPLRCQLEHDAALFPAQRQGVSGRGPQRRLDCGYAVRTGSEFLRKSQLTAAYAVEEAHGVGCEDMRSFVEKTSQFECPVPAHIHAVVLVIAIRAATGQVQIVAGFFF